MKKQSRRDKERRKRERDITEILLAQGGLCFYCGRRMPLTKDNLFLEITKDHFYPKKDGNSLSGNTVLCHQVCNEKKAHRKPDEWERRRFKELMETVEKNRTEIRKAYLEYHNGLF